MGIIEDLPQQPVGVHIWSASVATAPANLGQKIYVIIPAFDSMHHWGPCAWMPRVFPEIVNVAEGTEGEHDITIPKVLMPSVGDPCLVLLDNDRDSWIVNWWPY